VAQPLLVKRPRVLVEVESEENAFLAFKSEARGAAERMLNGNVIRRFLTRRDSTLAAVHANRRPIKSATSSRPPPGCR
jgi:hypothetical protein